MEIFLQALTTLLFLAIIWLGLKKVDASKYAQLFLAALDFVLLAIGVFQLGWLGFGVVFGANLLALLLWSIRLAMKKDHFITSASAQSNIAKKDLEDLYKILPSDNKVYKYVGPIDRAQLIYSLARRGRTVDEIRKMATPIALVWFIHKPELEPFVEKYDQLLRLWGKPADEAMSVADSLTVAANSSATTLLELLDGMIAFQLSSG